MGDLSNSTTTASKMSKQNEGYFNFNQNREIFSPFQNSGLQIGRQEINESS